MTAEKQVTNKHFERRWKVVDDSEWKKSIRSKVRRRKKIEVALEQIPYNLTVEITHSCKELKPAPTKSGYTLKKCELILAQNRIAYASNKFPYRINIRHGSGYRNGIHTAVVRKTSLENWKRNMHTEKREQEAQKYEKTTCYCDAPDHEMCWDGLVGLYDPNCSCCKDTQRHRTN